MLQKITETGPVALGRKLKDAVNTIIDELAARRLTAGHGIKISRYPSGTVISATAEGSSSPSSPLRPFIISVYNDSQTEIPAYSPAALNGAARPNAPDQLPAWNVYPAENDQTPWALSTGPIPPSSWGRAVLQGPAAAVTAHVAGAPFPGVKRGDPVIPSADGLIPGGSGGAVVLAPPFYNAQSGQWLPAVILLGQWLPPYQGYFRVRCVSLEHGVFRVEDGGDPSSTTCGRTAFPGLANIPRADVTVNFAANPRLEVFLVISYTRGSGGNPVYTAAFQAALYAPSGDGFAFRLATIYPTGKVIQTPYYDAIDLPGWVL